MAYTPDLERLLTPGAARVDGLVTYRIERHVIGDAVLPTGQVVGCDPLVGRDGAEPFTIQAPPGRYPLVASVAVLYRDGVELQRRVAALQLVVRDRPADRWEPALVAGQSAAALGDEDLFGYTVDAGMGTLADLAAVRALAGWDHERVEDAYIVPDVPQAPVPGLVGAVVDQETGANVVTVETGWGDGVYPTFVGRTSAGEVSSFLTDFMVLPDQVPRFLTP
ncbi:MULTISPECIES: DUF4241 domain-containing protein [unclassified Nonomuraea]|uniref:DUF4241 domain-containing protein n=1 Tax=unclassified Nonomuraea TaxID=2593643 RepID=UPI0033CF5D03